MKAIACCLVLMFAAAAESQDSKRVTPIVRTVRLANDSVVVVSLPRPGGGEDIHGAGSVIAVSGDVIVVTSRHVVGKAATCSVKLHDGTALTATIIALDDANDLALLRMKPVVVLVALKLAAYNDVLVGETVIAIGHPKRYWWTVTSGLVSAVGREVELPTKVTVKNCIQMSAPVGEGSSGGPVLNLDGEMIGVVMAYQTGSQGIGFAVNADAVKALLAKHTRGMK